MDLVCFIITLPGMLAVTYGISIFRIKFYHHRIEGKITGLILLIKVENDRLIRLFIDIQAFHCI